MVTLTQQPFGQRPPASCLGVGSGALDERLLRFGCALPEYLLTEPLLNQLGRDRRPDYTARLPDATHRAAASALSPGCVLKAIAAPGAALRTALMTTSNNASLRGGRRTPPPMITQS